MTRFFAPVLMAILLAASPALAGGLQDARAAGQVGEKLTGFAEALDGAAETKALVADVNAKRRAEYARISKENGQTVDVVGQIAAQEIIGKLPSGAKYQGSDGSWKTK